jgi:acetyl-CoA C-acetyltransferase
MPFAGGPYNNYVLQATCRIAELLRAAGAGDSGRSRTAVVSSVSGILTKQGFGVWSTAAPPAGFVHRDVSAAVAQAMPQREVIPAHDGDARVAGCTVLYSRDAPPRAMALVDTPAGQRTLALSDDTNLVDRMQRDEFVGRTVRVDGQRLVA